MLKCFNQVNNILLSNIKDNRDSKEIKSFSNISIPLDPQEFYKDFGYLLHPKTGEFVQQLTDYQYKIWNNDNKAKYRVVIKSQKVGLSTSSLLEDFHKALTTCKGKDILIIAQTQGHANEHLRTLKNLVLNSDKYRQFLITNPSELLLKEEKTKVGVAYIKNKDNALQPSRIIALGSSESSIWSWKQVGHIHFSDITASKLVDDSSLFAAAFSRLANTDGTMLIETPPRRPVGKVYEIYEKYYLNKEKSDLFDITIVKASEAVKAGLITSEFLKAEKERLGPLYSQFYEAEFLSIGGNLFPYEDIDIAIEQGEKFKHLPINPYCLHIGGVDFGFSSSTTALYIGELDKENNIVRVILGREYDKKTPSFIADEMHNLHTQIPNLIWFVDGANRGAVNECKVKFGEALDWIKSEDVSPEDNYIIPVSFGKEHKSMLEHTYHIITKGKLAIPKEFNKLESTLRTAWAIGFDLDKDQTMYDDSLDALRLMLKGVLFRGSDD
jgi:hypothetical protein